MINTFSNLLTFYFTKPMNFNNFLDTISETAIILLLSFDDFFSRQTFQMNVLDTTYILGM